MLQEWTFNTLSSSCADNPNYEVTMDANVEATLLTTAEEAPVDLLLEYDITRPSAGQLQLTDLCVRGKADAGNAEDGLPTFAALSKAAAGLCQFSQMPALDVSAAEVVLLIKANSLSTVRHAASARVDCSCEHMCQSSESGTLDCSNRQPHNLHHAMSVVHSAQTPRSL